MSAIAQEGREEEEEMHVLLLLHVVPLGQQAVPQTEPEQERQ